jgi:hypothetical protein
MPETYLPSSFCSHLSLTILNALLTNFPSTSGLVLLHRAVVEPRRQPRDRFERSRPFGNYFGNTLVSGSNSSCRQLAQSKDLKDPWNPKMPGIPGISPKTIRLPISHFSSLLP